METLSDTPYFGCSTKNQVLRLALDFLFFFWNKLKNSILLQLGISGDFSDDGLGQKIGKIR